MGGLDNSPTPAPISGLQDDPSESTLVSERLGQVDRRLDRLEGLQREAIGTTKEVAKLLEISNARAGDSLAFMARKEERELEALKLERERRMVSQEAATKRNEAEISLNRERWLWWRANVLERVIVPLVVGLSGLALGWATRFMGQGGSP
jgi:hypothetical protein